MAEDKLAYRQSYETMREVMTIEYGALKELYMIELATHEVLPEMNSDVYTFVYHTKQGLRNHTALFQEACRILKQNLPILDEHREDMATLINHCRENAVNVKKANDKLHEWIKEVERTEAFEKWAKANELEMSRWEVPMAPTPDPRSLDPIIMIILGIILACWLGILGY